MSFNRAVLLGSACAFATGATFARGTARAADRIDGGDVKALAAALALERAALVAYTAMNAVTGVAPQVVTVLGGFATDHTAHRDAIVAALAAAGQKPSDDVASIEKPTLATEADVLAFAYTVERALAAGHLEAVGLLQRRDLAKTTASILGVETAHVALLAEALRKGQPYPTSFVAA